MDNALCWRVTSFRYWYIIWSLSSVTWFLVTNLLPYSKRHLFQSWIKTSTNHQRLKSYMLWNFMHSNTPVYQQQWPGVMWCHKWPVGCLDLLTLFPGRAGSGRVAGAHQTVLASVPARPVLFLRGAGGASPSQQHLSPSGHRVLRKTGFTFPHTHILLLWALCRQFEKDRWMCLVVAVAGEDVREGMWRVEDVCCSLRFSGGKEPQLLPGCRLLALPR